MKLNELVEVDENGLTRIADTINTAAVTCLDVAEIVAMVRRELEGNERDLALIVIGTMLKEAQNGG